MANFDMKKYSDHYSKRRKITLEEKEKKDELIESKEKELLMYMYLYNTAFLPNITYRKQMHYFSNTIELYNYEMFNKVSKIFYASQTQETLEKERDKLMELKEYYKVIWEAINNAPHKLDGFIEYQIRLEKIIYGTEVLKSLNRKMAIDKDLRKYFIETENFFNVFYENIMKYFKLIEMTNEKNNGEYTDTSFVFEFVPFERQEEEFKKAKLKEKIFSQKEIRFKSPLNIDMESWLQRMIKSDNFAKVKFNEKTKEWIIPFENLNEVDKSWTTSVVTKIINSRQAIKDVAVAFKADLLPLEVKNFLFEMINSSNDTIMFEEYEDTFYIQNKNLDVEYNDIYGYNIFKAKSPEDTKKYNTLLIEYIQKVLDCS